jgi:GNAT superfamily N-acetyltransferase
MTYALDEFRYDDAASDLLRAQRSLFLKCFPENSARSASTDQYYFWKFHSVPHCPHSYEFVVKDAGALVAYYAALPYRYSIGGRLMTAGMVCDVMTHPDYRGKGLFSKVGTHALSSMQHKGIDFVTGFPIRPEVLPGHLKVGWRVAFHLPIYVAPLRVHGVLQQKGLSFIAPLAQLLLRCTDAVLNTIFPGPSDSGVSVESARTFFSHDEDSYNTFFASWCRNRTNYLVKTIEFFLWRLGAPGQEYFVVSKEDALGKVEGLAIVRACELIGVPSLAVLDLMVIDDDPIASRAILAAVKNLASSLRLDLVALMCSSYQAGRFRLLRNGFYRSPEKFSYIVKPLSAVGRSAPSLFDEAAYSLMWVDSDDL